MLFTFFLNSIIDFAIVKIMQRLVADFDAVWQAIISATKKSCKIYSNSDKPYFQQLVFYKWHYYSNFYAFSRIKHGLFTD